MAIQATNYDKTKEYSVAEIADVYHPNLLVNGDFQINQRGKKEYNFNKQGGYGLDMWQHRQGNYYQALIVTPIKGGGVHVKLSTGAGAGLRQYLDVDKFKIGQSYTTVIKIDNTEYKGMIILENSFKAIIENDVFALELGFVEENKIAYSLWFKNGNSEYDIWYVDLFEGDIAYPHVKEDYQQALLRCLYHVEYGEFACHYNNNTYFIPGFTYKYPKRNTPTIEFIKTVVDDQGSVNGTFTAVSQNACSCPFVRYNNGSAVGLGIKVLNMRVLISCEPL